MIYAVLAVIAAYLLGSVPTGYIFGRVLKNVDIRELGSGNVGATNVFRVVGRTAGITVLVIDFMKGFLAVTLLPVCLRRLFPGLPQSYMFNVCVLMGAAAIAGHVWTVFLRFKGGKGVATTAGVMAGLSPAILFAWLVVWICVFGVWRYVSLASIVATTALPVFAAVFGRDLNFVLFCSVLCLIVVLRHRSNIKRLLQGTEKKLP